MSLIAVSAATGRLGHAVLRELLKNHDAAQLLAVARSPEKLERADVPARLGDYADRQGMTAALSGVRTLLMISAPVIAGTDRIALHRNVMAAARAAHVQRIVFTSVIGGEAEAGTLFGPTQQVNRQAEADLAVAGPEWIVARNGLYLDLDLMHIRAAQASGVYRNNAGDGRCGYLSIEELAVALARLADDDAQTGRIYNLVGESLSQAELVELACEVFGLQVRYESLSVEDNIARFMRDERIAARGEEVAKMLTGCFQCIAAGAFDVKSDYARAAGREPRPTREQMERIRDGLG